MAVFLMWLGYTYPPFRDDIGLRSEMKTLSMLILTSLMIWTLIGALPLMAGWNRCDRTACAEDASRGRVHGAWNVAGKDRAATFQRRVGEGDRR